MADPDTQDDTVPLIQISVLKVPVFKREPFLLPLAPFLIIKINICALDKGETEREKMILLERNHKSDGCIVTYSKDQRGCITGDRGGNTH